jgi:hypothetical protein
MPVPPETWAERSRTCPPSSVGVGVPTNLIVRLEFRVNARFPEVTWNPFESVTVTATLKVELPVTVVGVQVMVAVLAVEQPLGSPVQR